MIDSGKKYDDEMTELEQLMQEVTEDNVEDFFAFVELLEVARKAGNLAVDTSTFYH